MRNILIYPIRAIIDEIPTSTAYYILCLSISWANRCSNAIELHFLDTTDKSNPSAFTPAHAQTILKFFRSLPPEADLFVCCDSGESRSAAVAASLIRYQGESDKEIWEDRTYHPNTHVYNTCCKIFEKGRKIESD